MINTTMYFLIALLWLTAEVSAACPITHAYTSKLFFQHFPRYSENEKKLFMAGTLLPDVRYLGETERGETHFEQMTLESVLSEPDPFMAGVKFHSYVDIERENLVLKEKIYDQMNENHQHATFLKLVEDEILFAEGNWSDVCEALTAVLPQELKYISEPTASKWHKILTLFFMALPSQNLSMLSLMGKGALDMTPEQIQAWSKELKPMKQKPAMTEWVDKLINHFETAFTLESAQMFSYKNKKAAL